MPSQGVRTRAFGSRSRISLAARRLKVTPIMVAGFCPAWSCSISFWMMSRVFPVPGPARTRDSQGGPVCRWKVSRTLLPEGEKAARTSGSRRVGALGATANAMRTRRGHARLGPGVQGVPVQGLVRNLHDVIDQALEGLGAPEQAVEQIVDASRMSP